MLDEKFIKPIPKYIAKRIRKRDENSNCFNMRFYAYLSKIQGKLVKITVVCKNYHQQWFCKQVAVHGVHSDTCFVRDMEYTTMGYAVGWYDKGLTDYKKPYEDGKWYPAKDKYYDPSFAGVINPKYALKFE